MLDLLLGTPRRRAAFPGSDGDGPWSSLQMSQTYGPGTRKTQAGTVVSQALALTYSACWCATRLLAEPIATLPLCLMRRLPDGGSEHAADHPKYNVVRRRPNFQMAAMPFREGRAQHQINYGNGFAEIEWSREGDSRSDLVALWPIHPTRVRPITPQDLDKNGRPVTEYQYAVRNNSGGEIGMTAEQVLHIPGALSEDGIWGKSIVAHARESIGMGLGMERHGATQFGSGNLPRAAIFMNSKEIKSSEARREWRKEFKEIHGSPDASDVALFPTDTKIQLMSFSNEAAQFLGSRSFGIHEIARWYGVPPHLLKEMTGTAGYNGLEHLTLEFLIFELMHWLVRWEEQCDLKLLTPEEQKTLYFQFDLAGLLRGDRKSRYESYEIAQRTGWMTINMINRLEGLPTIGPAGDQHFINMAYTTAERVYQGLPPPSRMATEGGVNVHLGDSSKKAETQPAAEEQPQALLELADVRQTGSFDCGAAATQTVALYFGKDNGREESDYIQELGTTEADGTEPERIIDWMNDNGLVTTSGQGMTLDDLRRFFADGKPVIVPLQMYGLTPEYDEEEALNQAGHYVVVQGMGLGLVFFQDPVGGRQMMAEADFDERWHDREQEGVVDDHFGIAVSEGFAHEGDPEEEEAQAPEKTEPKRLEQKGRQPATTQQVATCASVVEQPVVHPDSAVEEPMPSPAAIAAGRRVLTEALTRAFTREAHEAMRASKGDLAAWLADREQKQTAFLMECLEPSFAVLAAIGLTLDVQAICKRVAAGSAANISAACDSDTPAQFEQRMKKWSEQAEVTADAIIATAPAALATTPAQAAVSPGQEFNFTLPPPVFRFSFPAPVVNVPAPVIMVNVPEQPAPVVNIPAQPAPQVTVNLPEVAPVQVVLPEQKPPVINLPAAEEFDIVPERDEKTGLARKWRRVPRLKG